MDELKPCPVCGKMPSVGGGMLIKPRCVCYGDIIIEWDKWQSRPIEDALRADLARMTDERDAWESAATRLFIGGMEYGETLSALVDIGKLMDKYGGDEPDDIDREENDYYLAGPNYA